MPVAPWAQTSQAEHPLPAGVRNPTQRIAELEKLKKSSANQPVEDQERLATALGHELAAEQDPLVRAAILRVMAQLRTETAAAMLRQGLKDADKDVRVLCCELWSERGGPEAARLLSEAVASDTHVDVRLAATRGLGRLNDPQAIEGLTLALDDPDPAMQRRAVESLRNVTDADYGPDVVAWRQYLQGGTPERQAPSIAERFRDIF